MRRDDAVSRRQLFGGIAALGTAMAAGAAMLPALGGADEGALGAPGGAAASVPDVWDMEADIVVLGAGGAGLSAACTAKEAGASVVVLEKAGVTGGDTGISNQGMLGPWPKGQKELAGVDDTVEDYIEDLKESYKFSAFAKSGRPMPNEQPFTKLQCELTPEMMDWTSEVIGVGWMPSGMEGDPIVEGVLPQPLWHRKQCRNWVSMLPETSMITAFNAACKAMGVDIRLNTEADRLIVDGGRVVGVLAYDENDAPVTVKAAKAVIVATGSFCSNRGMMQKYLPSTHAIQGGGVAGATGDGVRMIREVGGSLSEMGLGVHWLPFEDGTNSLQFSSCLFVFGGLEGQVPGSQAPGVLLNYDGKRFVSESSGYNLIGQAAAQQKCQEAWYVFDNHPGVVDNTLNVFSYSNRAIHADTLEELCEIMRIPYDVAQQEIDTYNGYLESGVDEAFGKLLDGCQPIDVGPFWALNIRPRPYANYGGVDTNLDAQVLNREGNVIPGLYAAGIVTGSFAAREGFYYNGGVGQALVFGRLAAKNAVAEEAWSEAVPTGMESSEQPPAVPVDCAECHGDGRGPGIPNVHDWA